MPIEEQSKCKIVKFSMFSKDHIEKIKNACTDVRHKKKIVVAGKNSPEIIELKPPVTKKLINFFTEEGYEVKIIDREHRKGKKEIAGLPVDVYPLNHTNYDGGVLLNFRVYGKDDDDVLKNINKTRGTVMAFFVELGIPSDRICQEAVLGCEYKFY